MKKTVLLAFAFLLSLILFYGCTGEENSDNSNPQDGTVEIPPKEYTGAGFAFDFFGINFSPWSEYIVGNNTNNPYGETKKIIISNKSEIEKIFSKTYTKFPEGDNFQDIMRRYNDEYFNNHQLLTFFAGTGLGNRFNLVDVLYDEDILSVSLDWFSNPELPLPSIKTWFIIMEIEKIPVDTIIDVKINYNNELFWYSTDPRFANPNFFLLTPIDTEIVD